MRIALLDDEALELERLEAVLSAAEMPDGSRPQLYTFCSGQDLMRRLRIETFDLLVLDWQIPDLSGIEVLRWTQAHIDPSPAVMMVTGRSEEEAVVGALSAGAADYIQKPFRPAELVARVRNVLRQRLPTKPQPTLLVFGDLTFDTDLQTVSRDGKALVLAPREYKLALLFFQHMGRPLSRQYLYDKLWTRDEEFSSRSLDTHIYRIRTKLGLNAERGWLLNTVYGYGYRLTQREAASAGQ
jgi:two-component system response regulator TrcR